MTEHEKFKALLDSVGLTYASLAEAIGIKYDSVRLECATTLFELAEKMSHIVLD